MARRSSGRRSPQSKARRPSTNRQYPRTARLNALLREIVADFVERIDDDRLGFLTITGVEVDADLNKAEVFISALDEDHGSDEEILDALAEYRKPLQGEIGRSARLRKTPEVVFAFDPAVRAGARIEDILSTFSTSTSEDVDSTGSDDDTEGESQ
ncbi:MAG: 30S ribosome-binding factor RbfA [Actinomycetia bacterium]|nr:30S ribosome-binding factor RbfA [Actinomycetes bacterium]MCP4225777.1 30S ribosome-binding factor RbfA [Actinomycetes bacterium]MCP5035474.1 30S ribosome-binding factor RbfA [Actinomycetes bacterium]